MVSRQNHLSLLSLTAPTVSQGVVRGTVGQPVTLPCFYRMARPRDVYDVCWGRGACPHSKCHGEILHTRGSRVGSVASQRYILRGDISSGDVSLTIRAAVEEDAGVYCCRVEVPGPFNDIKRNIRLELAKGGPGDTGDTASREKPPPAW